MISSILTRDIDTYASDIRASSRLLANAKAGTLPKSAVNKYLSSIRFLLTQTPVNLELARTRATEIGATDLARFFEQKRDEEAGHHEWAESDLAVLRAVSEPPRAESEKGNDAPLETMRALIRETRDAIVQNPFSYLAYILFAEYFTVVLGPEWMAALESRCGIPAAALTAVSKHVELDKEHVLEGCREIDALVSDPALLQPLRATLGSTMTRFSSFCEEVCDA
jgi:hypothetical protein